MNRTKNFLLILLIFLFPLALANSINYQITENKVFVEINVTQNTTIYLPNDFSLLNITGNYVQNEKEITIFDGQIKFISKSYLEKSGKNIYFISTQNVNKNSSIKVSLPEKAILSKEFLIFPKNYSINTDGRVIIIEWKNNLEKEIFISYTYEKTHFWAYLLILSLFVVFFIFFILKRKNKKLKFTTNLFNEEKEIINYLLKKKNNSSWTKEIVKDLNISKVKLSRKIRNLEEKGLIQKIPYGNENRIILKK